MTAELSVEPDLPLTPKNENQPGFYVEPKKRETTAVDCGVIMSGQEMPTADIALFSRLIFLTFSKAQFSDAEKKRFEDMGLRTGHCGTG